MTFSDTKSSINISICNEVLTLLADKAIYHAASNSLLIADLHLGKIEHFRKNGIPLPASAAEADLKNLQKLIEKHQPKRVIFLGDLFHSVYNSAWEKFSSLLSEFPQIRFVLVIGNHDILDHEQYHQMEVYQSLEINDLILTHEPLDVVIEGKYNLCGHIHPGVKLRGSGKQSLRIPCFYFGNQTGILPSYGTFTGTHVLKPFKGDQVFVVKDDCILQVS